MTQPKHAPVVILGSGPPAGPAAVYAARANLKPLVITGMEAGGQLMTTSEVDNWPAAVDGIQGPQLMDQMQKHAERFGTEVAYDHIAEVDLSDVPSSFAATWGATPPTRSSSRPARAPCTWGWRAKPPTAAAASRPARPATGSSTAASPWRSSGAATPPSKRPLYLSNIASKVTLVHRRDTFRAEPILIDQLMKVVEEGKIELALNRTVEEILGDGKGVTGVRLASTQGEAPVDVAVDGVFIAIGHKPNTALFEGKLELDHGYVVTAGRARRPRPPRASLASSPRATFRTRTTARR